MKARIQAYRKRLDQGRINQVKQLLDLSLEVGKICDILHMAPLTVTLIVEGGFTLEGYRQAYGRHLGNTPEPVAEEIKEEEPGQAVQEETVTVDISTLLRDMLHEIVSLKREVSNLSSIIAPQPRFKFPLPFTHKESGGR